MDLEGIAQGTRTCSGIPSCPKNGNKVEWNTMKNYREHTHGFSLLELLIVVALTLVLGSIALPNMVTVISDAKLLGGGTNLSGLFQSCRMLAVKQNKTMTTRFTVQGNGPVAYVKPASDSTGLSSTDTQVQLGSPLRRMTTFTEPGAPTPLTSAMLGFTPQAGDASFNSRGMPCAYSSGICTTAGFAYYFKDDRTSGRSKWMSVSISPAGRIKRWVWGGTTWGD